MEVSLERLPESRVVLDITVSQAEVEHALEAAYRKVVRGVAVPGFRRGKAPRRVLERFVGRQRLWQEALDPLLDSSYRDAVSHEGLQPATPPEFDVVSLDDGEPVRFRATVTVNPPVELGDYRSIAMAPEEPTVAEGDVDRALAELQAAHGRWEPTEEPAQDGMLAVLDVEGTVGGQPTDPQRGVSVELGQGRLRAPLEEAVRGMRPGERRTVDVDFPADDGDAELAGRSGQFVVRLAELKRKELPALDDELAREVGEFASLEELRSDLTNRLRRVAVARADEALAERVIAAVVDSAQVELPPALVDREVEATVRDLDSRLQRSGGTLEGYLASQNQTLEDLRRDLRPAAERRVKVRLVLDAVARAEGLDASEDEVRQRIEQMAATYGRSGEALRSLFQHPDRQADLRADIRLEKAAVFLRERAVANEAAQGPGGRPAEEAEA